LKINGEVKEILGEVQVSNVVWETEQNLLAITELPPPLGGQGYATPWSRVRSQWVPFDAPEPGRSRIMHGATLELPRPARLTRLVVKPALGFHKCGSGSVDDWIEDIRLLGLVNGDWRVLHEQYGLVENLPGEEHVFALGNEEVTAALVEVRRSGLDGEWTPWNLVRDGLELWGRPQKGAVERKDGRLERAVFEIDEMPCGVEVKELPGEVRYKTKNFEVGFWLGRPGFSYLALNESGMSEPCNLLFHATGNHSQGPMLQPVGEKPLIAPALYCDISGTTEVLGNTVKYELDIGNGQQFLTLVWTVNPAELKLEATRRASTQLEAWESTIWRTTFDSRTAPINTIGKLNRVGRTGTVCFPVKLHAPRFGTLDIDSNNNAATVWRSDADRLNGMLLGELKLGEEATERGTYLLPNGVYSAEYSWKVRTPAVRMRDNTPAPVAKALDTTMLTALTTRPDTGTLSNNSVSIHCPMSMDVWARVAHQIARVDPSIPALDFLRYSLERWLDGGPGYASGRVRIDGKVVDTDDDYLITGASVALGLARYLEATEDRTWLGEFAPQIRIALDALRSRDLDNDGLIESLRRNGIAGEHNWSTNWYDVISFGWKDAWVNAILYEALDRLAQICPKLDAPELALGLCEWRDEVRQNYSACFLNSETGLIAGWRSRDGELHDYAFLAVNGAAVTSGVLDRSVQLAVMKTLWHEYQRLKHFDQRVGLPVNLWPIPDADLTAPMHGYAHGFYLNGALSLSQSHLFVEALFAVDMHEEAESVLTDLCRGITELELFAGSQSGVDWRFWDGAPCGYEGMLTEQFGIIATALERYAMSV